MNREEFLSRLGLSLTATAQEVDIAYSSKKTELESRSQAAPTEGLKKKYIAALEELTAGYRDTAEQVQVQVPTGLSATMMQDLPQAQMFATGAGGVNPVGAASGAMIGINPGDVLMGRYEVRRMLGAGGMGAVYAAFDKNISREIAIKVLLPGLLKNEQAVERFMSEARLSQQLSHPGVINVFDVQRTNEHFFITMEMLEGQTLADDMEARKRMSKPYDVDEMLEIVGQISVALSYAHTITVHRDIKPENIFITNSGEIKVVDFGIARVMDTSQLTKTGTAMGTAYYMAPEQLKGAQNVDPRSDQYSLAVIVYEMLSGELPVGMAKPLHELKKGVSKRVSAAISKGLASAIDDRFDTVEEFMAALSKKGMVINFPGKNMAIAAGIACMLLVGAFTYPTWRPLVGNLFQNKELIASVETNHVDVLENKKQWEKIISIITIPVPAEVRNGDSLLKKGESQQRNKKYDDALLTFKKANKNYREAISFAANQLQSTCFETQGRVMAFRGRFDNEKQKLQRNVQNVTRSMDKFERNGDAEALAKSKRELQMLEDLSTFCEYSVFGGSKHVKIQGKLTVAEGMLGDENYGDALVAYKNVEKDLQSLLPLMEKAKQILKTRYQAGLKENLWLQLVAANPYAPKEIYEAMDKIEEGNDFLNAQQWDDAATAFEESISIYDKYMTEGQPVLYASMDVQTLAKEWTSVAAKKPTISKTMRSARDTAIAKASEGHSLLGEFEWDAAKDIYEESLAQYEIAIKEGNNSIQKQIADKDKKERDKVAKKQAAESRERRRIAAEENAIKEAELAAEEAREQRRLALDRDRLELRKQEAADKKLQEEERVRLAEQRIAAEERAAREAASAQRDAATSQAFGNVLGTLLSL